MNEQTTESAVELRASPGELSGLQAWIVRHDESWLFTLCYVTAAVALSIWISLFWLLAVVGVHLAFEWVRQRYHDPRWPGLGQRVAWELKLDAALVLLALALAVYMELILGLAGLGAVSRLGVQAGTRAAVWSRTLRGVLLSLDDAAQVGRAVSARVRGGTGSCDARESDGIDLHPWRRWGLGDHVAIWLGAACVALIVLAPCLLEHQTYTGVWQTMLAELQPFPTVDGQ